MSKEIKNDKPHYYVDSNILIFLSKVENLLKQNVSENAIKTELLKRLNKVNDVEGIINLCKKVDKGEVGLLVTPSVIYEMSSQILANKPNPKTASFEYMMKHCTAKFPKNVEKYLEDVEEIGKKYSENRLFTNKPKDKLDERIMAEVAIDENASFIRLGTSNMTQLIFEIANKREAIFSYANDTERYAKASDASTELLRQISSNPDYQQAVVERFDTIRQMLVSVNVKEYFNPSYKGRKAPQIIGDISKEFTGKEAKPVLPSEEFNEMS